ncbi:hypothetical protein BU26DRAFT_235812 [Trematosphaeria pertusa]|uniref:Secreted protein n=1 Tax=Trematosphaeria pertusa TaxID=390896 RepID=A0A6A6IU79_9PLEO|nr:uncharacterized protein BU26DRAFT_235812 [Trematosphaeria pertusa]KAF2254101.1 hypothetical protein BU26DRAFT_235812 [Trematosphaeria pertusa]
MLVLCFVAELLVWDARHSARLNAKSPNDLCVPSPHLLVRYCGLMPPELSIRRRDVPSLSNGIASGSVGRGKTLYAYRA